MNKKTIKTINKFFDVFLPFCFVVAFILAIVSRDFSKALWIISATLWYWLSCRWEKCAESGYNLIVEQQQLINEQQQLIGELKNKK